MRLHLAKDLTLPVDVVTQTVAVLAKRRAGKSYTMRRLVEQLHHAGQQVVLVDPKGDQWGIRSAADGKGPGLPFVILGGERADVPLEAGAGEIVAKLVVEERVSVVLDLSLFRKHEVATFMTAFMENLYRLKAKEIYRTPVMLVIDEADAVAPQKPQKGEERMLGAAEDIVRRGGQRGIGCVLVTQRSAVLNKNVLTQAQILIVLRTIAPQDLLAMKAWVDVHGTDEEGAELMDSLPALPVGDAWVWSPGWPTTDGIFQRVHVLPIETFDSGATPKPGEKRIEPKQAADIDLDALKRQMAATIEKAKADDPRELRKQIAELKKQAAHFNQPAGVKEKRVETPILTDADRALLEKVHKRLDDIGSVLLEGTTVIADRLAAFVRDEAQKALEDIDAKHAKSRERYVVLLEQKGVQKVLAKLKDLSHQPPVPQLAGRPGPLPGATSSSRQPPATGAAANDQRRGRSESAASGNPSDKLDGAQQKILDVVAMLGVRGIDANRESVARWLDIHPNGGRYGSNLAFLRAEGYLDGFTLTEKGAAAARAMATGIASAAEPLDGSQREILALLEESGTRFTRETLAEALGIHPNGGRYGSNLARLRTMGLIPDRGDIYLTEGARR